MFEGHWFIKRVTEEGTVYYTGSGMSKSMHPAKLYSSLAEVKKVTEELNIGLPGSPWWVEEV